MSTIFPERFLPEVEAGGTLLRYAQWRQQNPAQAQKWDAYRDQVLAYKGGPDKPAPPLLSSHFGRMLVAAAELHVSVTDIGAEWPGPVEPPTTPVFTTNISDGQTITLPFTWTASVEPTPDSVQFWADGVLQALDTSSPFSHDLTLAAGAHTLSLCAWHGDVRTCMPTADFMDVTIAGTPPDPPPTSYDYRFATFNTATDGALGCFNRFQPAGSWWTSGSPTGTPWPDGGGLHEISTPHGPGINIVVTQPMDYVGATPTGGWDLSRFAAFHETANFRDQRHVWEWTWMWPSSGNPSGWANTWVTAEGLTFATTGPGTGSVVGHHLFLHYTNPMSLRFGRQLYSATGLTWEYILSQNFGVTFPADTYQHVRVEIFWTATTSGYIRVYTRNEGGSEIQWVDYSGVTLPTGWNPWTVYMNLRKISTHPRNQLHWINHRLTVL